MICAAGDFPDFKCCIGVSYIQTLQVLIRVCYTSVEYLLICRWVTDITYCMIQILRGFTGDETGALVHVLYCLDTFQTVRLGTVHPLLSSFFARSAACQTTLLPVVRRGWDHIKCFILPSIIMAREGKTGQTAIFKSISRPTMLYILYYYSYTLPTLAHIYTLLYIPQYSTGCT